MLTALVMTVLAAWPAKGDTVYVSATLTNVPPVLNFGVAQTNPTPSPIPACVPMKVTKAKPEKPRWEVSGASYTHARLEGPWGSRLHATEAECRSALTESGEPRIVRNNWIHTIVP